MIDIYDNIVNYIQDFTFCDNGYFIIYFLTGIYLFFINKLKTEIYKLEKKITYFDYKIDKFDDIEHTDKETQYEYNINLNNNSKIIYLDSDNYYREEFKNYLNNIIKCEFVLLGDDLNDYENILEFVLSYQPTLIILANKLKYKKKNYCGIKIMNLIKSNYNNCKFLIRSNDFDNNMINLFKDNNFDDYVPCKLSK